MVKIPKIPTRYMKMVGSFRYIAGSIFGVGSLVWAFLLTSEYVILDSRMAARNFIFRQSAEMQARYAAKDVVVVYVPPGVLMEMHNRAGTAQEGVTPRNYLASLVSAVSRGKPRVIGFDYVLEEPDTEKNDRALIDAVRRARSRGVRVVGGYRIVPVIEEPGGEGDTIKTEFVKTDITRRYDEAFTATGFLNLFAEEMLSGETQEQIVRYGVPELRDSGSFTKTVYSEYIASFKERGAPLPPGCTDPDLPGPLFINYRYTKPEHGVSVKRSDYIVKGGDVLPEAVLDSWFAGKIVLIANADIVNDVHRVPLDNGEGTYGVLVHASIMNNYLKDDFIQKAPLWISVLLGVLFFMAAFLIAMRFSVGRVLIMLSGLILLFLAGAYAAFIVGSVWVPVVPLFIVFFVTTMAVVVFRVIYTEKDRAEAGDFLKGVVPGLLMERLLAGDTSIFDTKKDRAYIVAGWIRDLPLGGKEDHRAVIRFLEWYCGLARHTMFESEGCFNMLPNNGFVGFWPWSFHREEMLPRAIEAAESILAAAPAISGRARKLLGISGDLHVDIAILEDDAFIGAFDSQDKRSYTLRSDAVNDILSAPSVIGKSAKSGVFCFGDIAAAIEKSRKTEKTKIKIAGKPVYMMK